MLPFTTEFPTTKITNKQAFLNEVLSWLKGMKTSSVLNAKNNADLDTDNASLEAASGEILKVRELSVDGKLKSIGFRHDIPDNNGRKWRTEAVLLNQSNNIDHSILRIRTQCLALRADAFLETPKKPFLVKSLIKKHWASEDGELSVSDFALFLDDNDDDHIRAAQIIQGSGTSFLPVVYISAYNNGKWPFTRKQANQLAFDLGGIAHVVVEPNRDFASRLRDDVDDLNPYNGAIGLISPNQGVNARYRLGWQFSNKAELTKHIKETAIQIKSSLPPRGWDWSDLQEQSLRANREKERNKVNEEDLSSMYEDELSSKQEQIQDLRDQIAALQESLAHNQSRKGSIDSSSDEAMQRLRSEFGRELYPDEFFDRLRHVCAVVSTNYERLGIDNRTHHFATSVKISTPSGQGLQDLKNEIRSATKDAKSLCREVTKVLTGIGYSVKGENKHVTLEPDPSLKSLGGITVPKTPSDSRGQKNLRSQIQNALGITQLK